MSDVIISRRGSSGSSGNKRLITEYIVFNDNWIVPEGAKDNTFDIKMIGGGGYNWFNNSGGCSGWFNNGTLTLTPGEIIPISIGVPAKWNNAYYSNRDLTAGGTTSFGSYLSANGGSWSTGGSGGAGTSGKQFGGGGGSSSYYQNGGSGGVWGGGGGGAWYQSKDKTGTPSTCGGHGGTYGGGGATLVYNLNRTYTAAGTGGTYGGAGGVGVMWGYLTVYGNGYNSNVFTGNKSTYGGVPPHIFFNNANNYVKLIYDNSYGIDTTNNAEIPFEFRGKGYFGKSILVCENHNINTTKTYHAWLDVNNTEIANIRSVISGYHNSLAFGGGGGYGGNGGDAGFDNTGNFNYRSGVAFGGGGGGYGSNGGNGKTGSGGGGGYGGDGGDGCDDHGRAGGGGGGYGKISKGQNAGVTAWMGGGGGGYYCPGGGFNNTGGAGGGFGIVKNNKLVASFGSGGIFRSTSPSTDYYSNMPERGVCIIQYYI